MGEDVEWRPIAGASNYEVSSTGLVRRWTNSHRDRRAEPRIARGHLRDGYQRVSLTLDSGRRVFRQVHSLVLETFVGPCPPGMQCRHFPDGNRRNNNLSNLQWGTRLENAADKRVHGTMASGDRNGSRTKPASRPRGDAIWWSRGEMNQNAKLSDEDADRVKEMLAERRPNAEIARLFKVTPSLISQIKTGRCRLRPARRTAS